MINAVIYARYSSDRQNEMSIEGQIEECRKYADNSLLQISIEDLDLVKLVSSDKYLELSLRAKLGELPIRITTG